MVICKFDKFELIGINDEEFIFKCRQCNRVIRKGRVVDNNCKYMNLRCKCGNLRVMDILNKSDSISEFNLITYSEYKKRIKK